MAVAVAVVAVVSSCELLAGGCELTEQTFQQFLLLEAPSAKSRRGGRRRGRGEERRREENRGEEKRTEQKRRKRREEKRREEKRREEKRREEKRREEKRREEKIGRTKGSHLELVVYEFIAAESSGR
ncbi:hypothetical protein HZH66_001393 [Vespula vulgaris]|uniref:Uncharacterized protein n=1 Tax=Vespula vulgaris TaxID=7454 RepID=A0A834KUY0_VESVU|nr:hypothetical protein HZH66_001393 [Vespula vulgaris]